MRGTKAEACWARKRPAASTESLMREGMTAAAACTTRRGCVSAHTGTSREAEVYGLPGPPGLFQAIPALP
jgi:hypothetical protein